MKEFIDKLISRLEEKFKYNSEQAEIYRDGSDTDAYFREKKDLYLDRANTYGEIRRIVNQLAEEYNNDFCEWTKQDGLYLHRTACETEDTYDDSYKFCPYCGKKIKIAPYQPKGE